MATKEQSMRKWISEMNMFELVHIERLVQTHKEKVKRQKLIEIEVKSWLAKGEDLD
tara:strand:- start:548 stop:715 length:168 start_codon:yes stop_codon:yes gene_type:complete